MRAAEASLDDFWQHIDQKLGEEKIMSDRLGDLFSSRKLRRTVRYVPRPPKAKALSQGCTQPDFGPNDLLELQLRTEATISTSAALLPKEKIKTAGSTVLTPTTAEQDTADASINSITPKRIAVNAGSVAVLDTLFGRKQRVISWQDVLRAMVDVGFSAQKLYG
jgi:hypothetical protein